MGSVADVDENRSVNVLDACPVRNRLPKATVNIKSKSISNRVRISNGACPVSPANAGSNGVQEIVNIILGG